MRRYGAGAASEGQADVGEPAAEGPAGMVPTTARGWAAALDELSGQLLSGPLGRAHDDHPHLYAALRRALGTLEAAHPGGLDEPDRRDTS
jgi:hypothetical protein